MKKGIATNTRIQTKEAGEYLEEISGGNQENNKRRFSSVSS